MHVCVQELRAGGLRMDRTFLTAVIAALGSEGLAQEALAVFRTMVPPLYPFSVYLYFVP